MARLCIRIAPNAHPTDPLLDALRTQEGDVVCLVDDGHVFSQAELTNGQYRILNLPGVPQEDLVHLVTPVEDTEGTMVKRRAHSLDPVALQNVAWQGKTGATQAELATITVTKG